jgi:hypothetical protein
MKRQNEHELFNRVAYHLVNRVRWADGRGSEAFIEIASLQ